MKVPILIPNIFNHPFTYETDLKLKEGDYVTVPFGKTELTGVVWNALEKNTNKNWLITPTKNIRSDSKKCSIILRGLQIIGGHTHA